MSYMTKSLLINLRQASNIAGVTKGRILKACEAGLLPYTANGSENSKRKYREFKVADVRAWAATLPSRKPRATKAELPVQLGTGITTQLAKLTEGQDQICQKLDQLIKLWS